MALAALTSYGLLERLGKGELKVTERARAILHFDSPGELSDALLTAAFAPQLYRDLRDRFQGVAIPPYEGVMSYLNRQGFNPAAVKPTAKAFLQTMAYLREQGVSESSGQAQDHGRESAPSQSREEPQRMSTATMERPTQMGLARPRASYPALDGLTLNDPNLNIRNGTALVEALLDFDGLTAL